MTFSSHDADLLWKHTGWNRGLCSLPGFLPLMTACLVPLQPFLAENALPDNFQGPLLNGALLERCAIVREAVCNRTTTVPFDNVA